MNVFRSARGLRVIALTCVIAFTLLFVSMLDTSDGLRAQAMPLPQDLTLYPPVPTIIYDPYPVVTNTPPVQQPTATVPTVNFLTPQPTWTTIPTFPVFTTPQTQPPDTFLTENAEIGSGRVTQPAGDTATFAPTPTTTNTPAPPTPQPTPMFADGQAGGPGNLNWGLFWIGFSVPVLVVCGWVLYLLDRRPELFRPKV